MQLLTFILAIAIDFLLKEPPNMLHPVSLVGKYISSWSSKGGKNNSLLFGTVLTIIGISLCMGSIYLSMSILQPFPLVYLVLGVFLLKTSFSAQMLFSVADDILHALREEDLIQARKLTAYHLVSRDTNTLAEGHIISAVIESLSENLVDSIISPLFYYLIGGVPLAWTYRYVNTSDAMIGYHNEKFEYLGKFTAHLDDVLNFIPTRISGGILIFAAFLCGLNFRNAWKTMLTQSRKTESPNAGIPMCGAAGALTSY